MPENRLSRSSSAYLRSASHQPIDWYEFNDEAFARAKDLDRLILLDIGAVWCHWCHVIDRESYENDEIARLINENYVPVKVDRDQRPDIDARYQQVVASMTGQGGWPLTAFLTYDGRVMYGGTYFPPNAMIKLLTQLKDVYHEQKTEIMKEPLTAASPEEITATLEAAEAAEAKHPIPPDVFQRIINSAQDSYDPVNGGFGLQPKFPHFSTLEFLIQQACRANDAALNDIIEKSLVSMANGGILDHIGGGFHRYSVDRVWHVPHFEKMAYDNAEALKVYAQGYRLLKNPLLLDVAEGIIQFTNEVLSDQENGGFYASQDADIDLNDDGDYFTWSLEEAREILTPEELALVTAYYDLSPHGDMHDRHGRNILWVTKPLGTVAQQLKLSPEAATSLLQSAKAKMKAKRVTRPTPFIDTTQYLNWNGMYMVGYFEAADLLDKPDVRQFARKTLDRMLETHVDSARNILLHVGEIPGMLDDYAWMIYALLKGYQSTAEQYYMEAARHWTAVACELFEDKSYGGFYDIPIPKEDTLALLKFRRKPTEDTPSSSANAIMLRNLVYLHLLTGEPTYFETADRGLRMFGQEFSARGIFASALVISLYELMQPPAKLDVVGQKETFKEAARYAFMPGKLVHYSDEQGDNQIRICEGTRCLPPITELPALEEALASLCRQQREVPLH